MSGVGGKVVVASLATLCGESRADRRGMHTSDVSVTNLLLVDSYAATPFHLSLSLSLSLCLSVSVSLSVRLTLLWASGS